MKLTFLTEFNSVYYRVNKRSGKKNLRCFPKCCPTGHADCTFCGQSVRVTLEFLKEVPRLPLVCFAEFGLLASSNRFIIGTHYPVNFIESSIQTCQNPEGSLFRCEITNDGNFQYIVEANKTLDAWNYPWTATRHFTGHLHVLRFNVFFFNDQLQDYLFYDSFDSPPFQLSCIRPSQAKGKELYQRFKADSSSNNVSTSKKMKNEEESDEAEEDNIEKYPNEKTFENNHEDNNDESKNGVNHNQNISSSTQSTKKKGRKQRVLYNLIENIAFGGGKQSIDWNPLMLSDVKNESLSSSVEYTGIQNPSSLSTTTQGKSDSIPSTNNGQPGSFINLAILSSILFRDIVLGTNTDFSNYVSDSDTDDNISTIRPGKESRIEFTRELIEFFMKNEEFTRNALEFFKSVRNNENGSDEISADDVMNDFTRIVIIHLKSFLSSKNFTLEDLEKKLGFLPRNKEKEFILNKGSFNEKGIQKYTEPRLRFLKELRKAACPDSLFLNTPRVSSSIDIEGTWLFIGDDNAGVEISKRLTDRGYPGFLFSIIRRAMMKMQININRDWLFIQGSAKLGLEIHQLFSLDGNVHPFVLPPDMPVVFPFRPISYIAYIDYKNRCVHLEETVACLAIAGSVINFSRDFILSDDGIEMKISTKSSIVNPTLQVTDTLGEVERPYLRIWTHDDEDELLKNVDNSALIQQLNKE